MLFARAVASLCAIAAGATAACAEDAFYKGKRLNLVINFAAGGPSDIEGRLLAKHLVNHIDGQPGIIVQNKDGAGGLVGATYIGELGPKDGTMFGYITAAAWAYATDPGSSASTSRATRSSARSRAMPSTTCAAMPSRA